MMRLAHERLSETPLQMTVRCRYTCAANCLAEQAMSQPLDDAFLSETSFHVRYAETDAMGFVHHAVYLVWFEEGRSAFIRARGWSYADIERSGYFLVASDLRAKYRRAARYDQCVTVQTWLAQVKSRQLTFACRVLDGDSGEELFNASLKLTCLNAQGAVTRIPDSWGAWLG